MPVRKKQRHISEEMWASLQNDSISQEEYFKILEHTCECTWCAEHLAHSMEQGEDLNVQPPAYLKEEILGRICQADVQTVIKVKRTSRNMQLMIYSLKVGLAVAVSVCILILTSNFQNIGFTQIERPKREVRQEAVINKMNDTVNGITDKLNEFSNFILKGGK